MKQRGRDYGLTGVESSLAVEQGLAEAEWFRPPLDADRLRELQQRNNHRAAVDTAVWLGLLALFGVAAWRSLGSWWAVPAFAAYGALYGGAGDSRWHECGHGTAFRSRWLNDIVYYLASFMLLRQPTLWRWSHVRHHTDTIVVGRDPEIIFPRPASPLAVVLKFVPVAGVPQAVWRTLKHAADRIDDDARDFIPEDELPKLKWESRAYIAILASVTAWSVAVGSVVPLLYIGLPTVYGAWLMLFFAVTQHSGLREDVLDHRLNTRTVYMNPLFRFLYSNMNYHVEHHIYPTVPYYALPALHADLKPHLAPASVSVAAAYREILTSMWTQWRDPTFDRPRPDVPDTDPDFRSYVDTGLTAWAGRYHDGTADLGPADMPPGSVRRVDVGDATYALYRLAGGDGSGPPVAMPATPGPAVTEAGAGERVLNVDRAAGSGGFVLSDGLCTHGRAHLAEGLLSGCVIECPKHNGCFDVTTGEAVRRPATKPLNLYRTSVRNGRVVSDLVPQPGVATGAR